MITKTGAGIVQAAGKFLAPLSEKLSPTLKVLGDFSMPAFNTYFAVKEIASGEDSVGGAVGGALGSQLVYDKVRNMTNKFLPNHKFLGGVIDFASAMVGDSAARYLGNKVAPIWKRELPNPGEVPVGQTFEAASAAQ